MSVFDDYTKYLESDTKKTFKEFMNYPESIPPHSITNWEQAEKAWFVYGNGQDKWNWLASHPEWLSSEMLENVKTELWVKKYYSNSQEIENEWTAIYRSKGYNGTDIPAFEQLCRDGIEAYLHIRNFKDDLQDYSGVPCEGAYRLLLLYERAGRFEDEFKLAEEVLREQMYGQKFWKRLVRAAKKLGIEISDEDKKLIEADQAVERKLQEEAVILNERLAEAEKKNPPQPSYRMQLSSDQIDIDQLTPASPEFTRKIVNEFYSDYPVKPFISKDQEFNNSPSWEDQVRMFPDMLVPKANMTRFTDGLLPGDVRLLYWLRNVHRKRIPGYFVYKYGIDFPKEKEILAQQGYIGADGKVTEKGEKAISDHQEVWL